MRLSAKLKKSIKTTPFIIFDIYKMYLKFKNPFIQIKFHFKLRGYSR